MRPPHVFMLMIFAAALAGCSPFHRSVPESGLIKAGKHAVVVGIELPKVSGSEGCGAQALAAAIAFANPGLSSKSLADELPWHDDGATPVDLLIEARTRGCLATIHRGDIESLKANISANQPMVVMLDAGLEVRGMFFRAPTPNVMHWAIVSGIANDGSEVLLAAERQRHHVASREDFTRRWEQSDFCMIVVRPGEN